MPFIRSLAVGDVVLNSLNRILRPGKWAKIRGITGEIKKLVSGRIVQESQELPKGSMVGRVQELLKIQEGNREGIKEKEHKPEMVANPVDQPPALDRREQHPQRSDGAHLPVVEKKEPVAEKRPEPVAVTPRPVPMPVPALVPRPEVKRDPAPATKPIAGMQKDEKGRYAAGSVGGWD